MNQPIRARTGAAFVIRLAPPRPVRTREEKVLRVVSGGTTKPCL